MRALAERLGYDDPWLRQDPDEIIAEVLTATARDNPLLKGITLERLQTDGTVRYSFDEVSDIPFEGGVFPTPDGRIQLRCEAMLDHCEDPLPYYSGPESPDAVRADGSFRLLSGAAHHFVNSAMANLPNLERKEGRPSLEINPADAGSLGIVEGQVVKVHNGRGSVLLHAKLTDGVRPGVVVSPKGHWGRRSLDGRNVNQLTDDTLSDMGGGSTFHDVRVFVVPATAEDLRLVDLTLGDREPATFS
jgi:anaerobic selenocysteine-containing dehydrogenase